MSNSRLTFDERLDRVRRIGEAIAALPGDQLQSAAFDYLIGERSSNREAAAAGDDAVAHSSGSSEAKEDRDGQKVPGKAPRKHGSRPPKTVAPDRTLELFPDGKISFKDFAVAKSPSSNDERYAVAVHWLLEEAALPSATVAQVLACFMCAEWRLPSNPANAASQSRKAGYLSNAKSDDLQLSSIGRNLVTSDLPRPKG